MTNLKTKKSLSPLSLLSRTFPEYPIACCRDERILNSPFCAGLMPRRKVRDLSLFISISLSLFIFIFLFFTFFTPIAHAAKFDASDALGFATQANTGGINAEVVKIEPLAGRIAKGVFSLGGLLFFLLVFYGGYTWLMARGEEEEIKKAQNIIIAACIGLFIMVGSYAITNFVLTRMLGNASDGGGKTAPSGPVDDSPWGCCLDEAQAPSGFWDAGSAHHWLSSIEQQTTCVDTICKTKSADDELVGSENCQFIPGVVDADICWEIAKNTSTN